MSVGLVLVSGDGGLGLGVIDERRRGHWIIAFESVLRRIGRYVKRAYWHEAGTQGGEGAG